MLHQTKRLHLQATSDPRSPSLRLILASMPPCLTESRLVNIKTSPAPLFLRKLYSDIRLENWVRNLLRSYVKMHFAHDVSLLWKPRRFIYSVFVNCPISGAPSSRPWPWSLIADIFSFKNIGETWETQTLIHAHTLTDAHTHTLNPEYLQDIEPAVLERSTKSPQTPRCWRIRHLPLKK